MTDLPPIRGTRRAVIDRLKADGGLDAKSLAQTLGLTPMAVRLQLYALRDAGLLAGESEPRPVGRPATIWRLTPAAQQLFPDSHAELAVGLLDAMEQAFGPEGMEAMLAVRARKQVASYRESVDAASPLEQRVRALAARRDAEGYLAEVELAEDGCWRLIERHCPICEAARRCRGLCASELDVFREVLGPGVEVEREQYLLEGDRVCAYRISV